LSAALIKGLWEPAFELAARTSRRQFASRCHAVLDALGTQPDELAAALDAAEVIVEEVHAACSRT
jgi:hypothetical protein